MTNRIEKSNLAKTSNKKVVIPQLKSTTPADMAVFLQEAFEAGDTRHIALCVGIAAKAIGIAEIAKRAGMKPPALYRLTDGQSRPRLDTILRVLDALEVKFKLVA